MKLADRISGGLLGVAAGDALGTTLEFMAPAGIAAVLGVHRHITGGGPFGRRPGQGSDDSDLTAAVLQAYVDGYSLDAAAANMLAWAAGDPPDIGRTTAAALAELRACGDPRSSGRSDEQSCGNGSLMRCIPSALARADDGLRRRELAEVCAVTHAHPVCVDSCVAYGEIAHGLLEGDTPREALGRACALSLHPQVLAALRVPADTPLEALATSGWVIDSLRCAAWAVRQEATFEETLVGLVNRGDDADTTGAIAGGLLGVLHGREAIPERWLEVLEYCSRFEAAAERLAELRRA